MNYYIKIIPSHHIKSIYSFVVVFGGDFFKLGECRICQNALPFKQLACLNVESLFFGEVEIFLCLCLCGHIGFGLVFSFGFEGNLVFLATYGCGRSFNRSRYVGNVTSLSATLLASKLHHLPSAVLPNVLSVGSASHTPGDVSVFFLALMVLNVMIVGGVQSVIVLAMISAAVFGFASFMSAFVKRLLRWQLSGLPSLYLTFPSTVLLYLL